MRVVVGLLFVVAACSSENAPPVPDAASPDAASAVCAAKPPNACDEVNQDEADCPGLEICDGVCNASYDCCFCGSDGTWQFSITDCFDCVPDAGP